MEIGKSRSPWHSSFDDNIPPLDPRTWLQFRMCREEKKALRIGIGGPAWCVKDWVGSVYPQNSTPQDFLFYYSRQFNSIELNSTHYKIPSKDQIHQWREAVPQDFRFNPKFPQEISHRFPLSPNTCEFREFIQRMMDLREKLGISFLQLPPDFGPDNLRELRNFLFGLPQDMSVAVDLRHPAFFQEGQLIDSIYDLLVKAGTHTVITDRAHRHDLLHSSLTSLKVIVRFVVNDLYPDDPDRLEAWARQLHTWIEMGLQQVEFFVHGSQDKNGPEHISKFIDLINERCGLHLRKWKPEKKIKESSLLS